MSVGTVDAQLSRNKRGKRVIDCQAGVLGWNPVRPKRLSPLNYFTYVTTKDLRSLRPAELQMTEEELKIEATPLPKKQASGEHCR